MPTVAVILMVGGVSAHHAFVSEFDDSTVLTLHGVVTSVESINPHSFIYLDVNAPGGAVERWALEGPSPVQLARRGLDLKSIRTGDALGVCGYPARSDRVTLRTEPGSAHGARMLQAAVVTMPGGDTVVWSNYRQGKCGLDH